MTEVMNLSGKEVRKASAWRGSMLVKKCILVAEGSDGNYFMLQRAFGAAKLPHMLRRVKDGAQAMAYVMGRDQFEDRQHFPYPDLVIAATALPKISGIEMLKYFRGELKVEIPAVILSASLSAAEMRAVLELGRAEYFVMPLSFAVLLDMVLSIQDRWLF